MSAAPVVSSVTADEGDVPDASATPEVGHARFGPLPDDVFRQVVAVLLGEFDASTDEPQGAEQRRALQSLALVSKYCAATVHHLAGSLGVRSLAPKFSSASFDRALQRYAPEPPAFPAHVGEPSPGAAIGPLGRPSRRVQADVLAALGSCPQWRTPFQAQDPLGPRFDLLLQSALRLEGDLRAVALRGPIGLLPRFGSREQAAVLERLRPHLLALIGTPGDASAQTLEHFGKVVYAQPTHEVGDPAFAIAMEVAGRSQWPSGHQLGQALAGAAWIACREDLDPDPHAQEQQLLLLLTTAACLPAPAVAAEAVGILAVHLTRLNWTSPDVLDRACRCVLDFGKQHAAHVLRRLLEGHMEALEWADTSTPVFDHRRTPDAAQLWWCAMLVEVEDWLPHIVSARERAEAVIGLFTAALHLRRSPSWLHGLMEVLCPHVHGLAQGGREDLLALVTAVLDNAQADPFLAELMQALQAWTRPPSGGDAAAASAWDPGLADRLQGVLDGSLPATR